ncbi:HK97 family phage prohead protease [Rhodococcus artemisiae]|uniref:HK97 family phage prohead protease n=1 Tax=Rhodococcus artemisiae TaxID=714159 RepID=A0ABU7L6R6_9NOCA|nr:HK97 family phage prohead protease [Rhodococcus artemisiae]MEE2056607.1 HK97 family phage prohead protease [Rhodococcus artemisiae]
MADRLIRTATADLEVRGKDGRTLVGIAVPYDTPTDIRDYSGTYSEQFRFGAFERTIRERGDRIKLLSLHDRLKLPIGRATLLREDTAGLYGEWRVSKTEAGDEVLELVRDGALDSFSIGFVPVRNVWSRDRSSVVRTEAKLLEVSVVALPAYETARIVGVRHNPRIIDAATAERRLKLLDME